MVRAIRHGWGRLRSCWLYPRRQPMRAAADFDSDIAGTRRRALGGRETAFAPRAKTTSIHKELGDVSLRPKRAGAGAEMCSCVQLISSP